jgi:DNA-binding YbaB/EbfC family protein
VLPGNMNMKKMGKILAQAQQAQEQAQTEIAALRITGSAGGGVVSATLDGAKNLLALVIAPEVLEDRDPELLADLVLAAVNDAAHKVDDEVAKRMGALSSMLGLPPGMGL